MSKTIDEFLLRTIQGDQPQGEILDLPAGAGRLSARLDGAGYQVVPSDLFPEALEWEGHEAVQADMNDPLPFDSDRFDGVVSQEGIEHLENLPTFLRECRRILKPGGKLWITTPNFMDLSSRLAFFLSGMKGFNSGFPDEHSTLWGRDGDRLYHGHAFTLPYFQLRYLLRVIGFEQVRVHGLRPSPFSKLLYPFLYPFARYLIWRAQRRRDASASKRAHRKPVPAAVQADLRRDALSPQLLCYRKICITCRVPADKSEVPTGGGEGQGED